MAAYSRWVCVTSTIFSRLRRCPLSIICPFRGYTTEGPISELPSAEMDESVILSKRNKSRMRDDMRKRMEAHLEMPDIIFDYQTTKKFQRRLLSKFGRQSGIDPSICWPTKEELKVMIERERECNPPLSELLDNVEQQKQRRLQGIKRREEKIEYGLSKLEKWMADIQNRKDKKLAEINAQKEKKERVIEEVRQYFGYRLDPKDPKFQEVLERKEKEERKLEKEARKKEKFVKEMARLSALAQQNTAKPVSDESQTTDKTSETSTESNSPSSPKS